MNQVYMGTILLEMNLKMMSEAGYTGSFTLEFTEGVNTPEETHEDLYQCALEDLSLLRRCLE